MAAFTIDVRSNLAQLAPRLADFRGRRLPFAAIYAMTKTAQDIQQAEYAAMRAAFDRPTRFTLASLYVVPATRNAPAAAVRFKEGFGSVPAWRYLGPQVEGGPRVKKSHERALERAGILRGDEYCVPGAGARLDGSGNMSGAQIVQILSQLQALPVGRDNFTGSPRSRAHRARAGTFFELRGASAPDGIYQRKGGRAITPVLIFVRQPRYASRLPFARTAEQTFNDRFAANFQVGLLRYPALPLPRAA